MTQQPIVHITHTVTAGGAETRKTNLALGSRGVGEKNAHATLGQPAARARMLKAFGPLRSQLLCACGLLLLATALTPQASAADYFVVVASFKDRAAAEAEADRLGLNVIHAELASGDWFRVIDGPFADRSAAIQALGARSKQFAGAWVTSNVIPVPTATRDEAAASVGVARPAVSPPTPSADAPGPSHTASVSASRPLTLLAAVETALERNLALKAGAELVAASAAEVGVAKSEFLPQLDFNLGARRTDKDRAELSFGRAPEIRSLAGLSLDQNVYSESVFARHSVALMLRQARELEQEGLSLDTVLETSVAFLNVLRADNLVRIQQENLRLSESNYQTALSRLELGVANRAEVYRFEAQRAAAKAALAGARAGAKQSRIALNVSMNLPLGDQYQPVEPNLQSPMLLISAAEVRDGFTAPAKRPLLQAFFVEEALQRSPELRRFRKELEAKSRTALSVRRSRYHPEVSATAELDQELYRGGAGTERFNFPLPGREELGGEINSTEWLVGIEADLPLYQGGAITSESKKLQSELDSLQLTYDEALVRVQATAMTQFHAAAARFEQIEYANTAARAGSNNLELISESYRRGFVAVIDLIDAQFTAISAQQAAANALYDFLIEYLRLQRLAGQFDLVSSDETRDAYRLRLAKYLGSR